MGNRNYQYIKKESVKTPQKGNGVNIDGEKLYSIKFLILQKNVTAGELNMVILETVSSM